MAGMMATSARPERKSAAHCEGTVNDKSYLPSSGPLVKPQTSGAVLGYCTMEMRSLVTVRGLTFKVQYNKEGFSERRSEEHTSELQSPYDLVCRLLLEK